MLKISNIPFYFLSFLFDWDQWTVQAADVWVSVFPVKQQTFVPYLLLFSPPQAAISAMNLEQQLSQYAFFNQQPSNQNQQVSHVPQPTKDFSSVQSEPK